MTLEMEPLELAMSELAQSGWQAGSSYDPVADAELMDEDKVEAAKREERKAKSGFFTCELKLGLNVQFEVVFEVGEKLEERLRGGRRADGCEGTVEAAKREERKPKSGLFRCVRLRLLKGESRTRRHQYIRVSWT